MALKLSDIRKAADKKFAPTEFELDDGTIISLKHPLRLDEKKRRAISNLKDSLDAEGADAATVVGKALTDGAVTPAQGKKLVASAEGDVAILLSLLEAWFEGTDMGEASSSES